MIPLQQIVPYSALYIDMTYSTLAKIMWETIKPMDRNQFIQQIQKICIADPKHDRALVSACVRTATDLLLQAMQWPPGTEIIMTGVNIPQMVQVLRYNGIVPVPVEVDQDTLGVSLHDVQKMVSPRTKAIMISYIYGAKFDAKQIIDWCHSQGIFVIEDQAESFEDTVLKVDDNVDIALFSFGTIKTCTAFGGAISIIRDNEVLYRKMSAIQDTYKELTKFLILKNLVPMLLLNNTNLNRFFRYFALNIIPFDYKEMVIQSIRGFKASDNFLETFRIQLPTPGLAMLALRLSTFNKTSFQQATLREINGQNMLVAQGVQVPGHKLEKRCFWLYPIIVPRPELTYKMLNRRGVDAYMGVTQLDVVESPVGSTFEYPTKTLEYFKNMIYLPIHQGVPIEAIQKICKEVIDVVQTIQLIDQGRARF